MNEAIRFERDAISRACKLFKGIRSSRARAKVAVALAAVIPVLGAVLTSPSRIMAADADVTTFTVDVALTLPYFQNNVKPAETKKDPNAFSPGDTFIQDGNIYPGGTIPNGNTDFDPASPGAIGKYEVRGTWITDLANFEAAAAHNTGAAPNMAFASEIFFLANGQATIMTDGMYPNAYFSALRAVLGGTGNFRGIVGEIREENIGETGLGFVIFG